MGVGTVYLGILTASFLIMLTMSLIGGILWVNYQMSINPSLEGYAGFVWSDTGTDATITITVRLVKGTPVNVLTIYLPTDLGVYTLNGPGSYSLTTTSTAVVSYEGFDGELNLGQEGRIIITITDAQPLFTPGNRYTGFVATDGGNVIYSFVP